MDLAKLARPWTSEDGEIACEWSQRELYKTPVIAARIDGLIGRISLFTVGGASVLRMWDPTHETLDVGEALSGLRLPGDRYAVSLAPVSRTPVESGYLECMRLTSSESGVIAAEAIAAFVALQLERYGEMEPFLRECYGTLTPAQRDNPRFRYMDYPGFDSGSMALGLGLFAEHTPRRSSGIWCWSRTVNWHK